MQLLSSCQSCSGFVPQAATCCPHCGSGAGVTVARALAAAGTLAVAAVAMVTLSACYGAPVGTHQADAGPPSGKVHGVEFGAIGQATVSGESRLSAPPDGTLVYELSDLPQSSSCGGPSSETGVRTITVTVSTNDYHALLWGKYPISPALDMDSGAPAVRITAIARGFDASCKTLLETSAVSGTITFSDAYMTLYGGDYPSSGAPLIQESSLEFDDGSSLTLTVARDLTYCAPPAGSKGLCR